jgi:sulfoxide reductase heme-binding subunit YedZ
MGVHVVVGGAQGDELGRIARLFDEWERVFSRFWPASELNRVNASQAPTVLVSPLFARAVGVALDAGRTTRGLVDPTLGLAVEAAGYDCDFPLLDPDGPLGAPQRGRLETVELAGRVLSRPPGVKLDLNGVVKAMAVDRALGLLAGDGFLSAGGDVASSGPTVVALPAGGSVRLERGGMATSGTTRRRWTRAGSAQHHLIDPQWTPVRIALAGGHGRRWQLSRRRRRRQGGVPTLLRRARLAGRTASTRPLRRRGRRPRQRELACGPRRWSGRRGGVIVAANPAWYVARAGGVLAFALLTVTVLLGLLLAGRKTLPRWPRFAIEDVHRFANLLTWSFVGVHVLALLADTFIGFSPVEVLVPFASHYRPAATAAGVVGAELLAALAITNAYRNRLPHAVWRRAHYLNFGVWALALVHGVAAGTDTAAAWAIALYVAAAASVTCVTAWRVLRLRSAGAWAARA